MVRKCKVCGESYKTCFSCEKERSWRVHTDTSEHYYIWTVLMSYQSTHDATAAYQALVKRGVDFQHTEGFGYTFWQKSMLWRIPRNGGIRLSSTRAMRKRSL